MDKFYQGPLRRVLTTIILFFASIIVLMCCLSHKQIKYQKEQFIGNWYYYEPDTIYNECYINDSSLIFFNLDAGLYIVKYDIASDSLILSNKNSKPYFIKDVSEDKIQFIIADSINLTFYKLEKDIEIWKVISRNHDISNEFTRDFMKRVKKNNTCK